MTAGAILRVAAGVALLAYAVVAFTSLDKGVRPLLPAVVGAYLLIRGWPAVTAPDTGGRS